MWIGDSMPHVNYEEVAERKKLEAELLLFAERIRERWPGIASLMYGGIIAVKMNRIIDLAQLMQMWTRDLGEAQRREIVRSDIDAIATLTLKAQTIE